MSKEGWQNEQAKEKNGGCELSTFLPIDSVLVQLLLSLALSQSKHTLVQQNVFKCMFVRAKCGHFLWNRTQAKKKKKKNISTVSDLKLL